MARSTYIYVVMEPDRSTPAAGFTVKHELVTWLSRREPVGGSIWRVSDGLDPDRNPVEITAETHALVSGGN